MESESDQSRLNIRSIDGGDLKTLRTLLKSHFNLNELMNLAVDLEIDYEEFPQTKSPFIRELISYCSRRNILNCLVLSIMQNRSLDNSAISTELSSILFKWDGCLNHVKMVVVIEEDLRGQLSDFLGDIATRLNISLHEIEVIGALRGSTRLLLKLPPGAGEKFIETVYAYNLISNFKIISVVYFRELDEINQTVWRIVTNDYPNVLEQTHNLTVFPERLNWKYYLGKAIKTIQDIHEMERGRSQILESVPEPTTITDSSYFSSDFEKILAFISSGFLISILSTILLIILLGDKYSTIQFFASLQYLTFEYETIAFLFGIIASMIVFWFQSEQIRWSFLFALGYGLGFPIVALLLKFERNDFFMTLLGNLFIFLLISFLINNLLNIAKKLFTKYLNI